MINRIKAFVNKCVRKILGVPKKEQWLLNFPEGIYTPYYTDRHTYRYVTDHGSFVYRRFEVNGIYIYQNSLTKPVKFLGLKIEAGMTGHLSWSYIENE